MDIKVIQMQRICLQFSAEVLRAFHSTTRFHPLLYIRRRTALYIICANKGFEALNLKVRGEQVRNLFQNRA